MVVQGGRGQDRADKDGKRGWQGAGAEGQWELGSPRQRWRVSARALDAEVEDTTWTTTKTGAFCCRHSTR